jgi:predicted SprT family Zn-dependent metalloprotease
MKKEAHGSYERKTDADRITPVEYSGPQEAFDHFDRELFDGTLPDVFITYQRKARSHGYFAADRFSGRGGGERRHHEVALNPDAFIGQTDKQICQTLVHEMHHLWQHTGGKPAPRSYHNKEWAAKMKANGLQPSSTGMVGGKETGQHMADYVIPGGRFETAYEKLAATDWKLNLESAHRPGPKGAGPNTNKSKFSCEADCGQNAWGKPSLDTVCVPCLIAKLQPAGIDVTILDGVRMRSADAVIAVVADVPSYETITPPSYDTNMPASYDTNPIIAEPAKPKRGRPRGSKNKAKPAPAKRKREKTAGEELSEALSRLETYQRKKQQQQNSKPDIAFETSKSKINILKRRLWRLLENEGSALNPQWGAVNFLTEEEKTLLQNIDREHPKLGDCYEAQQIELRVIEQRKKKYKKQKDHSSYNRVAMAVG